jgi:hypothetical protein
MVPLPATPLTRHPLPPSRRADGGAAAPPPLTSVASSNRASGGATDAHASAISMTAPRTCENVGVWAVGYKPGREVSWEAARYHTSGGLQLSERNTKPGGRVAEAQQRESKQHARPRTHIGLGVGQALEGRGQHAAALAADGSAHCLGKLCHEAKGLGVRVGGGVGWGG